MLKDFSTVEDLRCRSQPKFFLHNNNNAIKQISYSVIICEVNDTSLCCLDK